MNYRVEWLQSALDELATIWTQADSVRRQAITAASHTLDQRLRNDPFNEGESRPKGRRITFVPPLAVTFRLEFDGQTVSVLQVRMFRQRCLA
jgi:hypothetical protein